MYQMYNNPAKSPTREFVLMNCTGQSVNDIVSSEIDFLYLSNFTILLKVIFTNPGKDGIYWLYYIESEELLNKTIKREFQDVMRSFLDGKDEIYKILTENAQSIVNSFNSFETNFKQSSYIRF